MDQALSWSIFFGLFCMNEHKILAELEKEITPIVAEDGLQLWGVTFLQDRGQKILRVLIETLEKQSVRLDDCVKVSRSIEDIIAVKDLIPFRYFLEVSSVGLDCPLLKKEHYERLIDSIIKVKTKNSLNDRRNFKGQLIQAKTESFVLEIDKQEFEIPYEEVFSAKKEPVWN